MLLSKGYPRGSRRSPDFWRELVHRDFGAGSIVNKRVPCFTQLPVGIKTALETVLPLPESLRFPDGFKRHRQSFRYDGDRVDLCWGSFGFLGY